MGNFKIGNKEFSTDKTYVMGILNVTPDSFSDGGRFVTMDKIISHAEDMKRNGAAIIDIGGESTRPGYTMISDNEEIARVVPAIEAIKSRIDCVISVDTYKSQVAEAAICAGADLVNDIWGLKYDSKMARVIQRYGVSCAITHNKNKPQYNVFVEDCLTELKKMCDDALKAGISKDKIIADIGLGFAKSSDQNLQAMKHLSRFVELGYPVLVGASRKSFIGNALDLPVHDRLEGTLLTTALACVNGANFVRVHDVKENVRVIKMYEKIMGVE